MSTQTIMGTALDSNGDPIADAVVEIQFDDGNGVFAGTPVTAQTDEDGAFSVGVFNNTAAARRCLVRLPDDNIFEFDLDPEDESPDVGNLQSSGGTGSPRLSAYVPPA